MNISVDILYRKNNDRLHLGFCFYDENDVYQQVIKFFESANMPSQRLKFLAKALNSGREPAPLFKDTLTETMEIFPSGEKECEIWLKLKPTPASKKLVFNIYNQLLKCNTKHTLDLVKVITAYYILDGKIKAPQIYDNSAELFNQFPNVFNSILGKKYLILNEHSLVAHASAIYPGHDTEKGNFVKAKSINEIYPSLAYLVCGLCGETGEIAEKTKKLIRDKNGKITDEFLDSMKKEIGDVLWYLSNLCYHYGFNLADIASENIQKLFSRTVRGKIKGSGDNR